MSTILCYGDSNTYGFDPATGARFSRDVRWPGRLGQLLGTVFEIVEEGLNGRTTVRDDPSEDGRNGRTYLLPCLRSHAPVDLVVLMLGTNDLRGIYPAGAPEIASGVASLVELIQHSGAGPEGGPPMVLLIAPPPVGGGHTRHSELWGFEEASGTSRRLASLYRTVADDVGCAYLDAGAVTAMSALDEVHLDQAAHARLAEAIAEQVRLLLPDGTGKVRRSDRNHTYE